MSSGGRLLVFAPGEYAARAAAFVAAAVGAAVEERRRCALMLAGGSTPLPVYRALSRPSASELVRWEQVQVYFGDERAVPPDDRESNYGAAREALLRHVPIPAGQVYPMDAARGDRQAAADDYARVLPDSIDVLILGMGADGHTASLFPGSPATAERERRVVAVTAPKPPPARLTITPPVIAAAREIVVLVTGRDKGDTLLRALRGSGTPDELPIRLARRGTWVVDAAAASGLSSG